MPELVESLPCPKCGAPLPLAAGEIIVTCLYCGSTARMRGDRPFLLRHAMLAARLDRTRAQTAIAAWMDGGVFRPDDLRRASRPVSLECVYVPFFVFEVDATTTYAGVLTRTGTNERRSGQVPRNYFWKVLARRSTDFPVREYKIPLANKVPFDVSAMVPDSRFLNAEFDEEEAERIVREQVEAHERDLLKDLVDVVESCQTGIVSKDSEFLHAPLWFGRFEYRGRPLTIIVDAASGDIVRGDVPPPTGGFGDFLRRGGR